MEAVGLKTHIWNNNLRSIFLLAGFPILLLAMIYLLLVTAFVTGVVEAPGGPAYALGTAFQWMLGATPLALIVAAVWFAIAYFANTAIIAAATGARSVSRAEQPELYNLLENLTISRGLPMPKLNIIDTPAMNAFASGLNRSQYRVTVTTGLLAELNKDELEAVLGHELTHIINKDVRTMVVAAVFAGIFTLIAELIFRSFRFSLWSGAGRRRGRGGGGIAVFLVVAMLIVFLGRMLAVVVRMTLSRTREFVADAGSVELTKNPDAMISALRKISHSEPIQAPDDIRGMFIENPGRNVMGLFATHPPLQARIDALIKYAGGRDAPPPDPAGAPSGSFGGPWG